MVRRDSIFKCNELLSIMQDKYPNSDTSHVHFDILLRQRSKPNPVTRSLSRIYTLMTHTQQSVNYKTSVVLINKHNR